MKKYSKDLSTWANNVGSKEAMENLHNLIRYVTLTNCLEIHQRLHSVGNQQSKERTPCIMNLSPDVPLIFRPESTGNKSIPHASRENFIFDFFGGGHVNDYLKTKPSKNCQLYLLI